MFYHFKYIARSVQSAKNKREKPEDTEFSSVGIACGAELKRSSDTK
jgi:hypothetical protein